MYINKLLICAGLYVFLFLQLCDSSDNNPWSIYFEVRSLEDSSAVDSAKILISFEEEILLSFSSGGGYWGNGIYRVDGGSRERNKSVVENAIKNEEFKISIVKNGFYTLDTILSGNVLRDTVVSEFGDIEKRAPPLYLRSQNNY